MSVNNSIPKDEWVRLNVGGKVFQTTKDTLSRYPETFLDRLINGGLASEKDESGAYLIDADPEHFRTILNYLRRGSVTLDGSKVILGDLLREADFFNIEPLVNEIRQAMSAPDQITAMTNRILAKMDDMSKKMDDMSRKLSNIASMPSMGRMSSSVQPQGMPYCPNSYPRCQNCDKLVSCCNNPQPQKPLTTMPRSDREPMVCQNCNKPLSCCKNPQPMSFQLR